MQHIIEDLEQELAGIQHNTGFLARGELSRKASDAVASSRPWPTHVTANITAADPASDIPYLMSAPALDQSGGPRTARLGRREDQEQPRRTAPVTRPMARLIAPNPARPKQ